MYSGLKFCILGTRVVVDWSWILFLLIMTGALGGVVLPALYPEWDSALTWGMALAACLLFFVSVLVHELTHWLAARASRLAIREIALFPFGGIPNAPRASTVPSDEMIMAVVGPASSLLLGAVLLLLGAMRAEGPDQIVGGRLPSLVGLDPLAFLLLWGGAINLLLGALNLIPGFPLDGGRVLRSILWATTKNWSLPTEWASRAGQMIAWSLIAAGVWIAVSVRAPFAAVDLLGGFLLCFLGWVLTRAIDQMEHRVAVQDLLTIVPIARFTSTRVPTVPPNISLSSLMEDYGIGSKDTAFPVVDNEHLVGLICIQDVRKVPLEQWDTTEVGEVMTSAGRVAIGRPDRVSNQSFGNAMFGSETANGTAGYSIGHENG